MDVPHTTDDRGRLDVPGLRNGGSWGALRQHTPLWRGVGACWCLVWEKKFPKLPGGGGGGSARGKEGVRGRRGGGRRRAEKYSAREKWAVECQVEWRVR